MFRFFLIHAVVYALALGGLVAKPIWAKRGGEDVTLAACQALEPGSSKAASGDCFEAWVDAGRAGVDQAASYGILNYCAEAQMVFEGAMLYHDKTGIPTPSCADFAGLYAAYRGFRPIWERCSLARAGDEPAAAARCFQNLQSAPDAELIEWLRVRPDLRRAFAGSEQCLPVRAVVHSVLEAGLSYEFLTEYGTRTNPRYDLPENLLPCPAPTEARDDENFRFFSRIQALLYH